MGRWKCALRVLHQKRKIDFHDLIDLVKRDGEPADALILLGCQHYLIVGLPGRVEWRT